jgi:hypothetical protein
MTGSGEPPSSPEHLLGNSDEEPKMGYETGFPNFSHEYRYWPLTLGTRTETRGLLEFDCIPLGIVAASQHLPNSTFILQKLI